ncbi:MAG: pilus assembly protein PilM, partial [Verrucomicrobia bacterium]|nr:pilus assembly protein PilM [Verrucomicrobiota bacterium]
WDYQILGSSAGGELEVLLVAIKSDVVEGLFRVAEEAKLRLEVCDVSPAALCNAFRYNYGDLEDCTLLLDIGAKTSNLLFFERGKVFSRGINLGANSITQDFANESKLKFEVADQIKVKEGFVSLGGAYEEPENPHQATISKVARQFMTKLHIQVNQTIQFYRGQQGGSAPQRLFLAGGASVMPYTAQFFAEKLNVPVEYFNPFRNVQIDPAVNLEELARAAHSLGEVVGLGLRNLANCPVEMNLMPESTLRWRTFNEKKPYFIATVFSLVLVALAVGYLFEKLATTKEEQLAKLQPEVQKEQDRSNRFNQAYDQLKRVRQQADQVTAWMADRFYWGDLLAQMRQALIRAENDAQQRLAAERPGVQAGIWIEQMYALGLAPAAGGANPAYPGSTGMPMPPGPMPGAPEMDNPHMRATMPYGPQGNPYGAYANPGAPANPYGAAAAPQQTPGATGPTNAVTLICRAVSLANVDPSADKGTAFDVQSELKACPMIDPKGTELNGLFTAADLSGTFTFGVTVALKNPPTF